MNNCELKLKYENYYGKGEDLRYYFSPGRINVIGEHIDYNGGLVFPCAISLGTYACVSLREDNNLNLYLLKIHSQYHKVNQPLNFH